MSTLDNILKSRLRKGMVTLPINLEEVESIGFELKELVRKKFGRSFNIREVDTGSCEACEAEIIAANNPIYDISRFGVNFVASPRHADALLVTGPVSKNMTMALKKTFDAMPAPKIVIACGNCAKDGWLFRGSYYIEGGIASIIPVDIYLPGCPPTPMEIVKALVGLLKK
jgi:Ni,Fe-hydrogenase III small subunit